VGTDKPELHGQSEQNIFFTGLRDDRIKTRTLTMGALPVCHHHHRVVATGWLFEDGYAKEAARYFQTA